MTGERTALGWTVEPSGLTETLLRVQREYGPLPLYVTENGADYDDRPDASGYVDDRERVSYLARHLAACADALAAGVDLRGYFAWSLLDTSSGRRDTQPASASRTSTPRRRSAR